MKISIDDGRVSLEGKNGRLSIDLDGEGAFGVWLQPVGAPGYPCCTMQFERGVPVVGIYGPDKTPGGMSIALSVAKDGVPRLQACTEDGTIKIVPLADFLAANKE